MKTVDGYPQFEKIKTDDGTIPIVWIDEANKQISEWAKERRCLNCKHRGVIRRIILQEYLGCKRTGHYEELTFSCDAWEKK